MMRKAIERAGDMMRRQSIGHEVSSVQAKIAEAREFIQKATPAGDGAFRYGHDIALGLLADAIEQLARQVESLR